MKIFFSRSNPRERSSNLIDLSRDLAIGPHTINSALNLAPAAYNFLRFDISSNCNIHCIYCEVGRGNEMLALDKYQRFLQECVRAVKNVWLGCAMEPTINRRLTQFALMARKIVNPPGDLAIQTNGILLDRHDYNDLKRAGLTLLSLSIDSIRPKTMKELRDGIDVHRVIANVKALREVIPSLNVMFSTVVTSRNIKEMKKLIDFAKDFGVREIWLREVTFQNRKLTSDQEMLRLPLGKFDSLKKTLKKRKVKIPIYFLPADIIATTAKNNQTALSA